MVLRTTTNHENNPQVADRCVHQRTQARQMDPPDKEQYPSGVNLKYSTGAPMTLLELPAEASMKRFCVIRLAEVSNLGLALRTPLIPTPRIV
jgi:hypothetical protein